MFIICKPGPVIHFVKFVWESILLCRYCAGIAYVRVRDLVRRLMIWKVDELVRRFATYVVVCCKDELFSEKENCCFL